MANIGTFAKTDDGYSGTIKTWMLDVKVTIHKTATKTSERAPDYRVYTANRAEIGAGWDKSVKDTGRAYVSLKLDDPSFAKAIDARLFEANETPGKFNLVWDRE